MRKIIFLIILILISFTQTSFAKENTIREIEVTKADNNIFLNVKSDYKEPFKTAKNSGNYYIELDDSKLDDNYKTNAADNMGILTQEIGSKVRIYVIKNNPNDENLLFQANLISEKGQKPYDYNKIGITAGILGFILILALKFYSDTIKLAINGTKIKSPSRNDEGVYLNKQLLKERTKPQIVHLNSATVPINQDVYVNFEYAKNKQNIKVAI